MMPPRRKFSAKAEPWAEYVLDDGTVVRLRLVMVAIYDTGLGENGLPNYHLDWRPVIDVVPTETQVETARLRMTPMPVAKDLQ